MGDSKLASVVYRFFSIFLEEEGGCCYTYPLHFEQEGDQSANCSASISPKKMQDVGPLSSCCPKLVMRGIQVMSFVGGSSYGLMLLPSGRCMNLLPASFGQLGGPVQTADAEFPLFPVILNLLCSACPKFGKCLNGLFWSLSHTWTQKGSHFSHIYFLKIKFSCCATYYMKKHQVIPKMKYD